ncbi:hypothetical protein scyTo_0012371, partial [Scyliorhinus torazame]|nr:hypothetical protein [Scyliorhinus torazame]
CHPPLAAIATGVGRAVVAAVAALCFRVRGDGAILWGSKRASGSFSTFAVE